jgi:hypothetical protein
MGTVTAPAAPTNPKPLEPVAVTGRILAGHGQVMHDMFHGHSILEIESEGRLESYWLTLIISPDARIAGVRLQRFAEGQVYDLPASLDDCTCPDATYRPERPGGCRHQQALRMALIRVAEDNARPRPKPDRKTERDDLTGPHTNPAA